MHQLICRVQRVLERWVFLPPTMDSGWLVRRTCISSPPLHPPPMTANAEAALRRPHCKGTHGLPRLRWSWRGKGGCKGEETMARSNRGNQGINLSR